MRPAPRSPARLARRDVLFGLGAVGAGVVASGLCGISTALLLLTPARRTALQPSVAPPPTLTPPPALTPTLVPPPIVTRAAWGALPPDHNAANEFGFYSATNPEGWRVYATPLEVTYQTLVLHHSAFYYTDDATTLAEVQTTHRVKRGWADVGYHFMIGQSGAIFAGRDLQVRGTHVEGHNTGSVGICLLGNFSEAATPTEPQWEATQRLLAWLVAWLRPGCLAAHRDFNAQTSCPGDNFIAYVDPLAQAFGLRRGTGCYTPPADATPVSSACPCGQAHL